MQDALRNKSSIRSKVLVAAAGVAAASVAVAVIAARARKGSRHTSKNSANPENGKVYAHSVSPAGKIEHSAVSSKQEKIHEAKKEETQGKVANIKGKNSKSGDSQESAGVIYVKKSSEFAFYG